MKNLKELSDQSLIDELCSRGYTITMTKKETIWEQIQKHLHRGKIETGKTGSVSGASAMRPLIKTAPCTCDNQWCEECSPNPPPDSDRRFCRCGSALCPICRNNWGS